MGSFQHDTAAGRAEFEQRMETRRRSEAEEEWDSVRRGWCLGGENFRKELLEKMETLPGESHAGDLKQESAAARAERIIAEELQPLGWTTQWWRGSSFKEALIEGKVGRRRDLEFWKIRVSGVDEVIEFPGDDDTRHSEDD